MRRARSDITEETWIEVLTPHFRGEHTLGAVQEALKVKGFIRTTACITQAKQRFAHKIMTADQTYLMTPAESMPHYILQDLNALDRTINDLNMYITETRQTMPPLNAELEATAYSRAVMARELVRKCFETQVKAFSTKINILSERRTIIQRLSINKDYSKEELEKIGADYYKEGFEDAKAYFLELCKTCKGAASPIITAEYTMVRKRAGKDSAASNGGDKGEVQKEPH